MKSVALTVLELLAFNAHVWGHVTVATPISGSAQNFLQDVKWKLFSKFGEDQSKIELTILAVAGRVRTPDGWTPDAKVNLYSAQCYTLHWTDKNVHSHKKTVKKDFDYLVFRGWMIRLVRGWMIRLDATISLDISPR